MSSHYPKAVEKYEPDAYGGEPSEAKHHASNNHGCDEASSGREFAFHYRAVKYPADKYRIIMPPTGSNMLDDV